MSPPPPIPTNTAALLAYTHVQNVTSDSPVARMKIHKTLTAITAADQASKKHEPEDKYSGSEYTPSLSSQLVPAIWISKHVW